MLSWLWDKRNGFGVKQVCPVAGRACVEQLLQQSELKPKLTYEFLATARTAPAKLEASDIQSGVRVLTR
jgi:hypothetical protein